MQDEAFTEFVNVANFIYLVLFTIEIVLEVLASSPLEYWSSNWSKVDFFVVGASWVFTLIGVQAGVQGVRAVRFLRIIILFKHSKTIRRMVFTCESLAVVVGIGLCLMLSCLCEPIEACSIRLGVCLRDSPTSLRFAVVAAISPAFNVLMALVLSLYIYGVVGMQLYGNLELIEGTKINALDNFKDIFASMRLLAQLATGQDLKSLIYDVRAQTDQANGIVYYIFSFYTVAIFVFLNLFVAVLLEAFEREFDDSISLDVTVEDLTDLKDRWDKFCRELVSSGKVVPRHKCGRKVLTDMPLRYIREFMEMIPQGSHMVTKPALGSVHCPCACACACACAFHAFFRLRALCPDSSRSTSLQGTFRELNNGIGDSWLNRCDTMPRVDWTASGMAGFFLRNRTRSTGKVCLGRSLSEGWPQSAGAMMVVANAPNLSAQAVAREPSRWR